MNPFELVLGIEAKQPMDLAIPRTRALATKATRRPKRWPRSVKKTNDGSSNF
jgi:hypothetical protein